MQQSGLSLQEQNCWCNTNITQFKLWIELDCARFNVPPNTL